MSSSHPLRRERESRGWSQARIAAALGVSIRTVTRWEKGITLPYPYYREQLCALFNKHAGELGLLSHVVSVSQRSSLQECENTADSPISPLALFDPVIPGALGRVRSLVGRDTLLSILKQRLLDGPVACTALNGLPGVGKTALAIALVMDREVQEHFADGILWAGLGPRPDVLSHLARWGELLGVSQQGRDCSAWSLALRGAIGIRRMLLVLDDVWEIEAALALQVGGPGCSYMLTTRLPQVAFAFAQQGVVVVPELTEEYGLALLRQAVPQILAQEPEHARALVRVVGGLPLAVTLLSKYLAGQYLAGQPGRGQRALLPLLEVRQRLNMPVPASRLEYERGEFSAAPLSLHASIELSVQRLSARAQAALGALAAFPAKPNSFGEAAAIAVSGEDVALLDELWDAGLLESSGPGRYSLHQTIADYALLLETTPTGLRRLIAYLPGYLKEHTQEYEMLEQELPNLQTALEGAVEQMEQSHVLLDLIQYLVSFWRVRGFYAQADQYLRQALKVATAEGDERSWVKLLQHLAAFAELRGDCQMAESYGQQGLALARQLHEPDAESALLTTLGQVAFYYGKYSEAQTFCEEGLLIARSLGKHEFICMQLLSLSHAARMQGRYEQAEQLCQEGRALARQRGLKEFIGSLLAHLGAIAQEQGKYRQAERYCLEGLTVARDLGHREQLCLLLVQLGAAAYYRGRFKQATSYLEEGLALARQIGHRLHMCRLFASLGAVMEIQGEHARAENYLQEGLDLAHQLGAAKILPLLLMNMGQTLGQQGAYERAMACFDESVQLARRQQAAWYLYSALKDWGEFYLRYGRLDAAEAAFREVLSLTEHSEQAPQLAALAQYGLAQIAAAHGRTQEALHLGQSCLRALTVREHFKAAEVERWLEQYRHQ